MRHCPNPECPHLDATGRAGEYRDDIASCSDCGADLVPGEPPDVLAERDAIRWENVLTVPQGPLAQMAKTALDAAGVPSEVRRRPGEADGIVAAPGGDVVIAVPSHLAEAAGEILSTLPLEAVALPDDDDDLEFMDADTGGELPVEPAAPRTEPGATDDDNLDEQADQPRGQSQPRCPRCGSLSVMRVSPGSPSESRGFFKQLFAARPDWCCVSCEHSW